MPQEITSGPPKHVRSKVTGPGRDLLREHDPGDVGVRHLFGGGFLQDRLKALAASRTVAVRK